MRKSNWEVVLVEWCVGLLFVENYEYALFFVDGGGIMFVNVYNVVKTYCN